MKDNKVVENSKIVITFTNLASQFQTTGSECNDPENHKQKHIEPEDLLNLQ
jgi:hypothetical protein